MKRVDTEDMQSLLGRLDEVLAEEGELLLVRDGQEIARVLPAPPKSRMPSHAAFRAQFPRLEVGSEVLIREDRDSR